MRYTSMGALAVVIATLQLVVGGVPVADLTASAPAAPACNGEPMRGPVPAHRWADAGTEVVGRETYALGRSQPVDLVVRTGAWTYRYTVGSNGTFCGGMGEPTHVVTMAGAPIVGDQIYVHTRTVAHRGDSEWVTDGVVVCRGVP